MDVCGCSGISFELKGNIASPNPNAGLRISLDDTACKNADGSPSIASGVDLNDEVWWYDIPQSSVGADWTTLRIPLDAFKLGTVRYNDSKLDLRCIKAFEINYQFRILIDCPNGCSMKKMMEGSGGFAVRNLTTY